jgi:hypothetical protein
MRCMHFMIRNHSSVAVRCRHRTGWTVRCLTGLFHHEAIDTRPTSSLSPHFLVPNWMISYLSRARITKRSQRSSHTSCRNVQPSHSAPGSVIPSRLQRLKSHSITCTKLWPTHATQWHPSPFAMCLFDLLSRPTCSPDNLSPPHPAHPDRSRPNGSHSRSDYQPAARVQTQTGTRTSSPSPAMTS